MTDPGHLAAGDTLRLKEVLTRCPELDATAGHVNAFATMMCHRLGDRLPTWMATVRADELPELHSLVTSLGRDQAAVTNGLTLPYSSGAVDLLRKRVLLI